MFTNKNDDIYKISENKNLPINNVLLGFSDDITNRIMSEKIKVSDTDIICLQLIPDDSPLAAPLILAHNLSKKYILPIILNYDSANTLLTLCKHSWLDIDNSILEQAIAAGSLKCIKSLLQINANPEKKESKKITETEIAQHIEIAARNGNAAMVLALCQDDITKASRTLFFIGLFIEKSEEKLNNYLLTILRFTPIEMVDKLVEAFLHANSLKKELLINSYEKAKKIFYSAAPFLSRYSKSIELTRLSEMYGNNNNSINDLKVWARGDIDHGEKRKQFAMSLYEKLITAKMESPKENSFQSLPKSSSETQRAAALLEEIAEWRKCYLREDKQINDWHTPVIYNYAFGGALIRAVYHYSQSSQIDKNKWGFYSLTYSNSANKRIILNDIRDNSHHPDKNADKINITWEHGKAAIAETWQNIENLFEKIWSMDLNIPNKNKQQEIEKYKVKLRGFYSELAELVWLIGNTQPLKRGSGTFAELVFAILHIRHSLQVPILKLEFPQLDVLDIIFPLDDYKAFFPYCFYVQSTLSEHLDIPEYLHIESSTSLSSREKMKKIYNRLNHKKDKPHESKSSFSTNNKPPLKPQILEDKDDIAIYYDDNNSWLSSYVVIKDVQKRTREIPLVIFLIEQYFLNNIELLDKIAQLSLSSNPSFWPWKEVKDGNLEIKPTQQVMEYHLLDKLKEMPSTTLLETLQRKITKPGFISKDITIEKSPKISIIEYLSFHNAEKLLLLLETIPEKVRNNFLFSLSPLAVSNFMQNGEIFVRFIHFLPKLEWDYFKIKNSDIFERLFDDPEKIFSYINAIIAPDVNNRNTLEIKTEIHEIAPATHIFSLIEIQKKLLLSPEYIGRILSVLETADQKIFLNLLGSDFFKKLIKIVDSFDALLTSVLHLSETNRSCFLDRLNPWYINQLVEKDLSDMHTFNDLSIRLSSLKIIDRLLFLKHANFRLVDQLIETDLKIITSFTELSKKTSLLPISDRLLFLKQANPQHITLLIYKEAKEIHSFQSLLEKMLQLENDDRLLFLDRTSPMVIELIEKDNENDITEIINKINMLYNLLTATDKLDFIKVFNNFLIKIIVMIIDNLTIANQEFIKTRLMSLNFLEAQIKYNIISWDEIICYEVLKSQNTELKSMRYFLIFNLLDTYKYLGVVKSQHAIIDSLIQRFFGDCHKNFTAEKISDFWNSYKHNFENENFVEESKELNLNYDSDDEGDLDNKKLILNKVLLGSLVKKLIETSKKVEEKGHLSLSITPQILFTQPKDIKTSISVNMLENLIEILHNPKIIDVILPNEESNKVLLEKNSLYLALLEAIGECIGKRGLLQNLNINQTIPIVNLF